MIAFVLGNGTSRLQFDLPKLKQLGTIFGCNALYRDFIPDYLCAVDHPMVEEIVQNKVFDKCKFYIEDQARYQRYNGYQQIQRICTQFPSTLDSGNLATLLACREGYTTVYQIGFDYIGIAEKQNNVYSGTRNYHPPGHKHVPRAAIQQWYQRTQTILQRHTHTKIIRVIGNDFVAPITADNYEQITVEEFKKRVNYG